MKTVEKFAAQGDVLFLRCNSIPSNATPVKREGHSLVVTHSETGHHHVVKEPCVTMMEAGNPLICYLRMEAPHADVEHMRPWDTHETIRLLGEPDKVTYWEVRRQREYTPEGWRRVED